MSEMLKAVTDGNFDMEVLQADGPVLVDFWAEWCGPCKMIAPALEAIASDMQGRVKIVKLNIDDSPDVPTRYGIRSIPTLIVFSKGEVLGQKTGALPKSQLEAWLKELV